jgi:hypothetical protein
MRINAAKHPTKFTHEGAPAKNIKPEMELKRSVMAFMLWEDQFYENGEDITDRISALIPSVDPQIVAEYAIEARDKMHLRHVPLYLVREMAKYDSHKHLVSKTLEHVIQRADELSEFLALYWKEKRQPLSAQVKKGLGKAFTKFDSYQLAKYNRNTFVKLKDVMFLSHPKPKDKEQESIWKKLIDGTLEAPDTWEVKLSATKGENKKEAWERLLIENRMGAMAVLRNLRNFYKENVDEKLIKDALTNIKVSKVLPFRFIAAAKHVPQLEVGIEQAMLKCLNSQEKLNGKTILLVDVSGSMDYGTISKKSEMTRMDAACALAILLREICEDVMIFTFSDYLEMVPSRRGFALKYAIINSQHHNGTYLGAAVSALNRTKTFKYGNILVDVPKQYDRLIIFTDEQSHDKVPDPQSRGYMVNVGSYQHGVGYGKWMHIDGFSESIIDYIREYEKEF